MAGRVFTVLIGWVSITTIAAMASSTDHSAFALICPVCGGPVEKVGERRTRSLFACVECDCDVIVPTSAWEIARLKRQQKWPRKRSTLNPFARLLQMSVASGRGTGE